MIIQEFRILLPISVKEYELGHRWGVMEASQNETGGGEGFEWIVNEPRFTDEMGKHQYTHKILHLQSKVPRIITALAPNGSLEIDEKCVNAYPYTKTVLRNEYMKENFFITIDSKYETDFGEQENIHGLSAAELEKRAVIKIDFVNDPVDPRDYKEATDPTKYTPTKGGSDRGPMTADWAEKLKAQDAKQPHLCIYKLVKCEFKWVGLQQTVESRIMKSFRRIFHKFHREVYCSMNDWYGVELDEILKREEETKNQLDKLREDGIVLGMSEK